MPLAVIHWKALYRLQSCQSWAKNNDWPGLASSKLCLLPDGCLKMLRGAEGCAHLCLERDWNGFLISCYSFLQLEWHLQYTFESKQCSFAASSEVSCCRTWGPSTPANYSALLWISAFGGKPTWSLAEILDFQRGYPLLLPTCPPSSLPPAMEHLLCMCPRVMTYNCLFHSLPTEHSKFWQRIDPSCGSCLVCPYVKNKGNGIMYYCNEESRYSHKLQWRSMQ